MAVALKSKYFTSVSDLTKFTTAGGNNVTTVVSIIWDSVTGRYLLIWT